jgi:hypothetical protein
MRKFLALTAVVVATLAFAQSIEVTFGKFQGSPKVTGRASIVERDGKRSVDFKWNKIPDKSLTFRLVKKETLKTGAFPSDAEYVDLGKTPKSVMVSKQLDVWLYRTVAAVDSKNQTVAYVLLRSAQEAGR